MQLCLGRPGSVIVDFFITSSEEIKTSGVISQALQTNMKDLNFNIDPLSIAQTGKRKCCTFLQNKYAKLCQICKGQNTVTGFVVYAS